VEGNLVHRAPVNLRLGFGDYSKYRYRPFLCPFADAGSFNDAADLLPGIVRMLVAVLMFMLMVMMFVIVFMVMVMLILMMVFIFVVMFVFMMMMFVAVLMVMFVFVFVIAGYMIGAAFNIHHRMEAGDAVTLIFFEAELPAFQSQFPQFRCQGLPIHTEIDKGSQAHIPRYSRKTVKMQCFHFSNP
jgi:hypothetical protein